MGVSQRPASASNGQDAPPEGPAPWTNVDAGAVIHQLSQQIAGLHQALAMRDAYIEQLHQALSQVANPAPG